MIAYDRNAFYAAVRQPIFSGHMTPSQVEGCDAILSEAEKRGLAGASSAYILATAFWETGRKMQPVSEIGKGQNKPYGVTDPQTRQTYYGRGLVQLTWKQNYEKFAKSTSLDLVNDPDLALQPSAAIRILFEGMVQGLFTGKKLGDFLAGPVPDFFNARRIVNGTDKAAEIAGFARAFESGLAVVLPSVSIPLSRPGWLGRFRTYLGY